MREQRLNIKVSEPDLLARISSDFDVTRNRIRQIEKAVMEDMFRSAYRGVSGPLGFQEMSTNINRLREGKNYLTATDLELLAGVYATEYRPILVVSEDSNRYYLTL